MSQSRKAHLDALERRLTGAKRIALFGHRAVGKTTLLAMFYREASSGRVPGVRLAAVDSASAEYLAEKIAQIEAGEPPAGTLAETPLKLRLYHGMARFDLVVKDYQGEHVSLGTEAPIQEFFADCDAVLLCLDPEGSDRPVERRRRQQEVENLLERYIETTDDATTGRPVALLVTKYDRVVNGVGAEAEPVDRLVESRYGMTRHALRVHAPQSAMFAVSSYGPGAGGDGRPPADLQPIGLEGPLAWLADQLEAGDREQLDWLWDLAPEDLPRLSRCVKAYEKRYPRSEFAAGFRRRLNALRWRRRKRSAIRLVAAAALVGAALVGYDAWGYRSALAFERENPAPTVEKHWGALLAWHPTLPWTWPGDARRARQKLREWQVKAAGVRVAVGTAGPDVDVQMRRLKEQAPELVAEIRHVEDAQQLARHDLAWRALRVADLVAVERPEEHLAKVRAFLHDFPETTHKAEAVRLAKYLEALVATRRDRDDRQAIDALNRAADLPNAQLRDLIERADQFLAERPESRYRGEVEDLRLDYVRRLDEGDIEKARQFSKASPHNFAARRQKYLDYLRAHRGGGRFVGEANAALERIDRERDTYLYRQAYDHYVAHPDDVAAVAGRLRAYLDANPQGRYVRDADAFLKWWSKASTPHEYRVTLRRGEVGPEVGKALAGAPSLGVELWVAGVKYGPSPTIPDTRRPTWDYTFPRPVRWKYGDLVSIRLVDHDWWSASGVLTLNTPRGDKLGMRMLSGTVRPSKGGKTSLTFASDFAMPRLSRPVDWAAPAR